MLGFTLLTLFAIYLMGDDFINFRQTWASCETVNVAILSKLVLNTVTFSKFVLCPLPAYQPVKFRFFLPCSSFLLSRQPP